MVHSLFPHIPIIFDSKRGDIATSSANYAHEAFDAWQADSVTVSPYMGSDSVLPFVEGSHAHKGIYVLNRTSNPGGKDLQQLMVLDNVDEHEIYLIKLLIGQRKIGILEQLLVPLMQKK
jgi:orotidine-5'-phosphate decarboxylase